MKIIKALMTVVMAVSGTAGLFAEAPANYYSTCENKGGSALLTALQKKIGDHTAVSYDALWDVYKTSDVKANGKIWDMYSTKEWTPDREKCGNYKVVGDCYNREHSMPKSWFNDAKPMYTDAFHLYPTDGRVNGQRSDHPYGECAKGTTLPSNGSVRALGRLGSSTFPGYSGTVFEPDDEYKGDFARTYFYMAAAYNDKIAGWDSDMLAGNAYPAFTTWAVELLMKWHRQDPVSTKEIARNEAVYAYQHNRNPFIDHPEMAEYIWGDKKTEKWTASTAAQAQLTLPVNNVTVDMGTVAVGVARPYTITVKGTALKNNLTAALSQSGSEFTLSTTSLPYAAVNQDEGTKLTVTVNASQAGKRTATLTLKSAADNIEVTVPLTALAVEGLPATEPTNISDCSFEAHWTYIGGEDSNGCYTLYVQDTNGNDIDTYPRSVPAKDESYLVDELEAETTYLFHIANTVTKSNVMTVTTASPIPSIQIMYDGDLELVAEVGEPSQPAELLLDIENIFTDITFRVNAPFQLSSDKSSWSTTLEVDPREDRMYVRILCDEAGTFTSPITATAGTYFNDNAEVTGIVNSTSTFLEDFDNAGEETGNYSTKNYTGNAATWELSNAGVYRMPNEAYSGTSYLRLGKDSNSSATMTSDKTGGMGLVTLQAAAWSNKDGSAKIAVDYSADGGTTWTEAGILDLPTPASSTIVYNKYTVGVYCEGDVRLRLRQTYGERVCIDDVTATNYSAGVSMTFGDEQGNGWDAWCENGTLVVSLEEGADVAVHGVDGVTYVNRHFAAGRHEIELANNLYVVVVGKSTRRVLVK